LVRGRGILEGEVEGCRSSKVVVVEMNGTVEEVGAIKITGPNPKRRMRRKPTRGVVQKKRRGF